MVGRLLSPPPPGKAKAQEKQPTQNRMSQGRMVGNQSRNEKNLSPITPSSSRGSGRHHHQGPNLSNQEREEERWWGQGKICSGKAGRQKAGGVGVREKLQQGQEGTSLKPNAKPDLRSNPVQTPCLSCLKTHALPQNKGMQNNNP